MLRVSAGSFEMGCDGPAQQCNERELPLHTVYLDAFYVDVLEVTNAQYKDCVGDGDCDPPAQTELRCGTPYYGSPAYDDHPVIHITWSDARAYCTWAGKRLPTEAEWERAARGSLEARVYPWGNDLPDCTRANYYPDAKLHPDGHICVGHPEKVGSYPTGVSVYGMHDMAGNVREWVNDWYQADYYSEPSAPNPQGPETGQERVIRGGGWSNDADNIRVAARDYRLPGDVADDVGFRCAADAP
jgi:eukaryotic-like serine/threonine-protein kinase